MFNSKKMDTNAAGHSGRRLRSPTPTAALRSGTSVVQIPGAKEHWSSGKWDLQPGAHRDVCMRLQCTGMSVQITVLTPETMVHEPSDGTLAWLRQEDSRVLMVPDYPRSDLFQRLQTYVQRRYFYEASDRLYGRKVCGFWAWYVDFNKPRADDELLPENRELSVAELEGKRRKTRSSRRRWRRRQLRRGTAEQYDSSSEGEETDADEDDEDEGHGGHGRSGDVHASCCAGDSRPLQGGLGMQTPGSGNRQQAARPGRDEPARGTRPLVSQPKRRDRDCR